MTRLMILLCAVLLIGQPVRAAEPTIIKPAWEVKLPPYGYLPPPLDTFDKEFAESHGWCRKQIESARKVLIDAKRPLISPYEPCAAGALVVAPTVRGPWAVPLEIDKSLQEEARVGQIYWEFVGDGMAYLAKRPDYRNSVERALPAKSVHRAEQVFSHTLAGIGSSSSDLYFAIDDRPFYPLSNGFPLAKNGFPLAKMRPEFDALFNYFDSIALDTGKLTGKTGTLPVADPKENALSARRFLGAPLPTGKHLFVINEMGKDLQLVAITATHRLGWKEVAKFISWQTALLTAPKSTAEDFLRRIHALIPVATDKLIICPTHLGAVVAVNRDDHKVAWTARYGKPEDKRFENFSCTWRVRPLLVSGDLLIYGPPDAESLYAFKLADGKEAWKIPRGKGVYLAGLHDGKAIVVDSDAVRAVDVANGKEVWKVPIEGTLTGYGVFNDERFYQPLGLGKNADEGILQVIDLKTGKAAGTIQRADKKEFGNLLIHKGKLISQTFESLSVFAMP